MSDTQYWPTTSPMKPGSPRAAKPHLYLVGTPQFRSSVFTLLTLAFTPPLCWTERSTLIPGPTRSKAASTTMRGMSRPQMPQSASTPPATCNVSLQSPTAKWALKEYSVLAQEPSAARCKHTALLQAKFLMPPSLKPAKLMFADASSSTLQPMILKLCSPPTFRTFGSCCSKPAQTLL